MSAMAQEILTLLADHARARVAAAKAARPLEEVRAAALALPKGDFAFERALAQPGLRFICECKRASPSKGLIAPEFPYLAIAREYAAAGADAISVLTEPKWFLGSDRYLLNIKMFLHCICLFLAAPRSSASSAVPFTYCWTSFARCSSALQTSDDAFGQRYPESGQWQKKAVPTVPRSQIRSM